MFSAYHKLVDMSIGDVMCVELERTGGLTHAIFASIAFALVAIARIKARTAAVLHVLVSTSLLCASSLCAIVILLRSRQDA